MESNAEARARLADLIAATIVEFPPSQAVNAPVPPNLRGIVYYRPDAGPGLADIERAATDHPGDAEARAARALEYIAQGHRSQAVDETAFALGLNANCATAHVARGWIEMFDGNPTAAIAEFDRAAELAPGTADPLWGKASAAMALSDKTRFFGTMDALLRAHPDIPLAHALLGMGSLFVGQNLRAKAEFQAFTKLVPQSASGFAALCTLYSFTDDARHALESCDRAIALGPNWAPGYAARSSAYQELGRYPLSITDASRAIQIDPAIAYAYGLRCGSLLHEGRLNEGLPDCDKEDALAPENTTTGIARGNGYTVLGRYQDAIDTFTKQTVRFPWLSETYMDRGNVYADEGDYAAAIRDWTKAIGMRPDRALLYTGRGAMFLMEGDYQNAADDYRHAIALDVDAPDAHGRLGMALFALGRFKEAEPELEKRAALDPTSPYAAIWLHLIRLKLGKDDSSEFASNEARVAGRAWPVGILHVFDGRLAPEKLQQEVAEAEGGKPGNLSCETNFYVGEFLLSKHRDGEAAPLIAQAATLCPPGSAAKIGASGEQNRLH